MQKKILNISIRALTVIVLFTLGVKLQSCDDKHYSLTYTAQIGPHCNDGVQDYDETGVDCGGADCKPCAAVLNVPCNTNQNQITYTDDFSNEYIYTISATGSTLRNGDYAVKCVFGYGYDTVYFQFPVKPTADGIYLTTSRAPSNATAVYTYLDVSPGYEDFYTDMQNPVYVRIINGQINIYMCYTNYYDYYQYMYTINPMQVQVN